MSNIYVLYITAKDKKITKKVFYDLKTARNHAKEIQNDKDNYRGVILVDAIEKKEVIKLKYTTSYVRLMQ